MTNTIAFGLSNIQNIRHLSVKVMIVSYSQQRIHEYFIIKTKCININFSLKNTNFVTQYIFYSFRKKITGTTTKGGGGARIVIFFFSC